MNTQDNAPGRDSPAIERDALESLALLADEGEDLVGEILDLFLEDSNERMRAMTDAVRAKDPEEAARAAHAMKSSSRNVGARALSELCRQIESGARDQQELDDLLAQSLTEYEVVCAELRAIRIERR